MIVFTAVALVLLAGVVMNAVQTDGSVASIHDVDFRNFTYDLTGRGRLGLHGTEPVNVRNGLYSRGKRFTPDYFRIEIAVVVHGNLGGDAADEVVVEIVDHDSWDIYWQNYLLVFTMRHRRPAQIGMLMGGSAAYGSIQHFEIEHGALEVDRSADALAHCCAQSIERRSYVFVGAKLRERGRPTKRGIVSRSP